jgi:ubiquinone/menaquinone biosynthesis C-methylase UbiE
MANTATRRGGQCQKPSGLLGRFVLWQMNSRHSKVTDWGLRHTTIHDHERILDVGCGGGRTVSKLAAIATEGKVYGIDYSSQSVAVATKINRHWINVGRVEIQEASVSRLPFPDHMFDLVTAVETHFWWPDLPSDMREVLRVIKPGGRLVIIAEVYKGASSLVSKMAEKYAAITGMALLSADEHNELFASAGFTDVEIATDSRKGWICAIGRKP